jgi:hypothetical protein
MFLCARNTCNSHTDGLYQVGGLVQSHPNLESVSELLDVCSRPVLEFPETKSLSLGRLVVHANSMHGWMVAFGHTLLIAKIQTKLGTSSSGWAPELAQSFNCCSRICITLSITYANAGAIEFCEYCIQAHSHVVCSESSVHSQLLCLRSKPLINGARDIEC